VLLIDGIAEDDVGAAVPAADPPPQAAVPKASRARVGTRAIRRCFMVKPS
jgi:hypothetical protein